MYLESIIKLNKHCHYFQFETKLEHTCGMLVLSIVLEAIQCFLYFYTILAAESK